VHGSGAEGGTTDYSGVTDGKDIRKTLIVPLFYGRVDCERRCSLTRKGGTKNTGESNRVWEGIGREKSQKSESDEHNSLIMCILRIFAAKLRFSDWFDPVKPSRIQSNRYFGQGELAAP
jgi:hypothetical protein